MREYKTVCIDNVTGCEMVLSECSYNFACDYLMRKGFTDYDSFESCSADNTVTTTFSKPVNKTFIYDESRGYLLTLPALPRRPYSEAADYWEGRILARQEASYEF